MSSTQECKNCGNDEFEEENYERVCTNCGSVVSSNEGFLSSLPDHDAIIEVNKNKDIESKSRLTGRIRGETQSAIDRKNVNIERNLEQLKHKVKLLIKEAHAVDETIKLTSQVVRGCRKRLCNDKKLGFAGACIYFVSSKYQLGLSLTSICTGLCIKLKTINVCLRQVKEICHNYEFERPNIKDLAKKYIDEWAGKMYCKSSTSEEDKQNPTTPLISLEDVPVLYNRVLLLVDLFEATHPFKQPNPQTLIIAVVYHAWRSLDTFKLLATSLKTKPNRTDSTCTESQTISQAKHSISFDKFCSICNLKYSSNGYRIVRELQVSLLTLGRYLGNVDKTNLPWYLDNIIDNSSDLMKEHKRSSKQQDNSPNNIETYEELVL